MAPHEQVLLSDKCFANAFSSSRFVGMNEAEVEQGKCECCGMTEDCTKPYIQLIRAKFSGRWICGLCSEDVNEEMKKVGDKEEALDKHMKACSAFSRIGRTQPVLYQAEAMRQMFRKCSTRLRDQMLLSSPAAAAAAAANKDKRGIMRTSSCIAAITNETKGVFPES